MKIKLPGKSIVKWQMFLLAGLAGLSIIAGGYAYYSYEEKIIRQEKFNELDAIAELKINQILQWRKERLGDANVVVLSPFFRNAIELYLAEKNNLALRQDILNRLSIIKTQYEYNEVFVFSPDGNIFLSTDTVIKKTQSISTDVINKAFEQKTAFFTDFYFCNYHNQIRLDVTAPILDKTNKPVAILVLHVNPSDYIYPLIQSWPTPSKSAETLIIRKDGDSVLYVNELRHISNTALKLHIPITDTIVPAVQAVLGHTGIWEGIDYRGIEVLSDIRPISGTPWFMIAKIDKEEIFTELYFRAILVIVLVSLLIILLGAVLAWSNNSLQKKTYKELLLAEKKLHIKEDEFRTTLYSIGDGIITTGLNGCIRQMNNVAEQLTGWTESSAEGKYIEEVFKIINEDTREKVDNPVEKVLSEGVIVGLANHTLLISAGGKETPIADSGAPIKSDSLRFKILSQLY